MKLRHTKYPSVKISLPTGGYLQFEGFVCFVSPQTIESNGESFFEELARSGKVIIEQGNAKRFKEEDSAELEVSTDHEEEQENDSTNEETATEEEISVSDDIEEKLPEENIPTSTKETKVAKEDKKNKTPKKSK